jgi:hypothetical protein
MADKKSMKQDLEDIRKTYTDSVKDLGNVASDLGSRAVDKAKSFGSGVSKEARNYGRLYKEGLGMKNGGSASSRADGCAMRGKTRGKIV